jgi:4a-hydroxytetrahydrobiopterin dehydratase
MWIKKDDKLNRIYKFKDFVEAFSFMTEVAFHAEKQNHHPDWTNVYNTVTIQLNTHDAGGIVTDKDYALAEVIEGIYKKYQ